MRTTNKIGTKRVKYPPFNSPLSENIIELNNNYTDKYMPLNIIEILNLFPNLPPQRKKVLKKILKLIKPNILMTKNDDNLGGVFVFLDSRGNEIGQSYSNLITLIQYFFGFKSTVAGQDMILTGTVDRPPDALQFLNLLKQSRVPARYLNLVIRKI